jgi:Protein of unknown function (DUF3553)
MYWRFVIMLVPYHIFPDTVQAKVLNLKDYMLFGFRFTYPRVEALSSRLIELCKYLMEDYKSNAAHLMRGATGSYTVYAKKSKPIIDEIDRVLAQHYGFTDEELDFIINYDIKYRMGKDAEGDDEDESGEESTATRPRKAAPATQSASQPAQVDRFTWQPGDLKPVSKPTQPAIAPAPQPTLSPEQEPESAMFSDPASIQPSQESFEPRPRQMGLDDAPRQGALRAGDRVRHHVFGEGQVLEAIAQGDDQKVTVSFKSAGKKLLMAKAARLERIDH